LVAGIAFLAIRFDSVGSLLTTGRSELGGDLYQMFRIRDFQEPLPTEIFAPPVFGAPSDSVEVAFIGDSHLRFGRVRPNLGLQMERAFPNICLFSATAVHPRFFDPLDMLRLQRIHPGRLKVVVWESAERSLPDVVLNKIPEPFHAWDTTWRFDAIQMIRKARDRWFTGSEEGYQFLLMNLVFVRSLEERWNSIRFRVSGTHPASIGAILPKDGQYFLAEELNKSPIQLGGTPTSYLQVRDSILVDSIASGLASVAERLKTEYGAELLVLPIPAKSSLLHARLGFHYDAFLPRLREAMARRGVRSIDSWSALSAIGDSAVLRTDTHLSKRSYRILFDSIRTQLGSVPGLEKSQTVKP
jgi:hypothetical protein